MKNTVNTNSAVINVISKEENTMKKNVMSKNAAVIIVKKEEVTMEKYWLTREELRDEVFGNTGDFCEVSHVGKLLEIHRVWNDEVCGMEAKLWEKVLLDPETWGVVCCTWSIGRNDAEYEACRNVEMASYIEREELQMATKERNFDLQRNAEDSIKKLADLCLTVGTAGFVGVDCPKEEAEIHEIYTQLIKEGYGVEALDELVRTAYDCGEDSYISNNNDLYIMQAIYAVEESYSPDNKMSDFEFDTMLF